MKLEIIRNRPYYLKTGPSELVEFGLEYVDEGRFDPAEIMQYRMMSSVYDSLGDALDDEDAEPKK